MLEVSCIIINFNTSLLTVNAVKTLIETNLTTLNFELIVVDNASSDSDYISLKNEINSLADKRIKLIRSKTNLGFGGGNMLGIKHSSDSTYFAFINSDTIHIEKNGLSMMKTFMDDNIDVGVCGPQMLDEKLKFCVSFDHFSSLPREIFKRTLLETFFPKRYKKRKKKYFHPLDVDYVQGAFLFVRSRDFIEIGAFDERIFLYYEESDVSMRFLKFKDLRTVFLPNIRYIHLKSRSMPKNMALKIEQKLSLIYHTKKHYGALQTYILKLYLVTRYSFTSIVKPKYFKLLIILLKGGGMEYSIRNKQGSL
ncbi:MAG TPA: glycosyltransferase family 2 protein [Flavobacteriaceae bacterium]|jgi:GT2 family glycosyltransferase|nr:glycosyltransferase family 2 protein [Flavobacteriaceae bacterium]